MEDRSWKLKAWKMLKYKENLKKMAKKATWILIIMFLFNSIDAQQSVSISITFGSYTNDHLNKKFYSSERHWDLHKKKLTYYIDAHDKRYSDTIQINNIEIEKITKFISENDLLKNFSKEITNGYNNKNEYSETLIGTIIYKGKKYRYHIIADSYNLIEKEKVGKSLIDFESVFYKIIENHR